MLTSLFGINLDGIPGAENANALMTIAIGITFLAVVEFWLLKKLDWGYSAQCAITFFYWNAVKLPSASFFPTCFILIRFDSIVHLTSHKLSFYLPLRATLQVIVGPLVFCMSILTAHASSENQPHVINQSLDAISFQIFVAGFRSDDAVGRSIKQVSRQRSRLLRCISDGEANLRETTDVVGQEVVDTLKGVLSPTTEEDALVKRLSIVAAEITECKLLLDKSNKLLERLTGLQASTSRSALIKRDPHIHTNARDGIDDVPQFLKKTIRAPFQSFSNGVELTRTQGWYAIVIAVLALVFGFFVQQKTPRLKINSGDSFSRQLSQTISHYLKKRAVLIMPLLALILYMFVSSGYSFSHSYINQVLLLGLAYVVTIIIAKASLRRYRLYIKVTHKVDLPVKGIFYRVSFVTTLIALWIFYIVLPENLIESSSAQLLVRNIFSTIILGALIELSFKLPPPPLIPRFAHVVRFLSILFFAASMLLDWVGYHGISQFLWRGVVLTTLSLAGFYFIEKLFRDFYEGLENGTSDWQNRFRSLIGVKLEESIPGLIWLKLLSVGAIWVMLILAIMKAWGSSDAAISSLFSYARDGVEVGDSRIIPVNVIVGILVFALLLTIFRWFKGNLDNRYLSRSRMDSGAREALITVTGYVGFVLAALIGLSIAGFSFGNLAIIAGALSLGIGFGLQNIVNNFVSGIILLFERPIKTGDWIVTGGTEGYVKKIRVRSTEVQTFDRSDVIVPNSDLISTSVTNWTLRDKHGRVIVPVGVAYGSDVELVRQVLMELANETPEVIKILSHMPIKVLFRGFGDSTLNFELRCFIYDIGTVVDVSSALHFAIDKRFRQEKIEIAFPQRDLHIKGWNPSFQPHLDKIEDL